MHVDAPTPGVIAVAVDPERWSGEARAIGEGDVSASVSEADDVRFAIAIDVSQETWVHVDAPTPAS